jgi:hypothetical protein
MVAALGACTQPAVAPKAPAFQESENTARDWVTVAQQIAGSLSQRGFLPSPVMPGSEPPPPRPPIFVQVDAPGSTFLQEVRQGLQDEILRRGGTLSRMPANSVVVNLDVDVVRWGARNQPAAGLATVAGLAAGTGVLLANAAPLSPAAGFGIAAGAGLALDAILAMTPRTNTEAIWKASIIAEDQVVLSISGPVYIGPSDASLYASETRLSPTVSFSAANQPIPRQLRFVP